MSLVTKSTFRKQTAVPKYLYRYLEHIHICTLITAVSLDVPIRYHVNNLLGRLVQHAYFMCSVFATVGKYFFFVGNKLDIIFRKKYYMCLLSMVDPLNMVIL